MKNTGTYEQHNSARHQGLPRTGRTTCVDVPPGASFDLAVGPVAKSLGGTVVQMLAYNTSIPGPTLRVRQGSEIAVNVINKTTMDTTVHWHGLRLENLYDGVPHETQGPIPPGGRYTHRLVFPDPGLYWYHPHIREDYAQEMGLYGNVLVEPSDPAYWPPRDRDVVLTLDDILIEDGKVAAFDPRNANYAAMGRFGNLLLVGGETEQRWRFERGEVVRFYLTNTANTRVFKVALPGAQMKLIGGDSGRYEREELVDHVVIAPSERTILDIRFPQEGGFSLQHITPGRVYELASIDVVASRRAAASAPDFERLRVNADMVAERQHAEGYLAAPADKTLALVAVMDVDNPEGTQATEYRCPMHPHIVRDSPGRCPICGMKLLPADQVAAAMGEGAGGLGDGHHDHAEAMADGIEWEDMMPEVNRETTSATMHWQLVDRDTGAKNRAIDWHFTVGEQVKIRLVNEMDSDHPMHHPFHVHGERFLILTRDGVPEPNLVWKDTVLIRTGETVDILMDASNPGLWMAHCHIAEHMETGMMFSFRVTR